MAQRLRTATPMADWRSVKCNSGQETYTQYDMIKINELVGVVLMGDVEMQKDFMLFYHAEKILVDKVHTTGDAFQVGDKVFWSGNAGDPVTPHFNSADPPMWIGMCVEDADQLDTTVLIDLKGDKATYLHVL